MYLKMVYVYCDVCIRGTARYQYAHEILPNEESQFNSEKVERSRRISVICRSEPLCEDDDR